jgi:hypothetical protein
MVVGLTIGLLALYLSNWFAVPFLALVFVIPVVLEGIICPKCGTPVTYQGTFFGVRVGRVHPKNVPAVRLGLEHEVHGIEIGDDRAARLTSAVATVCYSVLQLVL